MGSAMRCPRCWKWLPPSARFCRRCGHAFDTVSPLAPPARTIERVDRPPRRGLEFRGTWIFVMVAAMSLVRLATGIGLFGHLHHRPGPPPTCPFDEWWPSSDVPATPAEAPPPMRWEHGHWTVRPLKPGHPGPGLWRPDPPNHNPYDLPGAIR